MGTPRETEVEGTWILFEDVVQDPPPSWEYGLNGPGPLELVASTGTLAFTLDNSISNAAGLAGYYSPGHINCMDGFQKGLRITVLVIVDDDARAVKFTGQIVGIRPLSGVFDEATTAVECRDWIEHASIQRLGPIAILANKRADEALYVALGALPIQPGGLGFDEGIETWTSVFNTDDSIKMSIASVFQKFARNEGGGWIFLGGNGQLRFENRQARLTTDVAFTFNAPANSPMNELDVFWDEDDIKNRVECKMFPARVDAAATTIIWKLQKTFPLSAGASLVLTCPFRDPATGERISALEVVDPLVGGTHIKFGSVDDGASNDLIGNLTFPMVVGGNSADVTLTNTGGVPGYVNFIELIGKGLYVYDPLVLAEKDDASIADVGQRLLAINLEQIVNPNTARTMAVSFLSRLVEPPAKIERVRFLANASDEFALAALTADPNIRFGIVEGQTGIIDDYFVCRLKFEQIGPLLWVELIPAAAGAPVNYFIWDLAGHGWDEGRWTF